MQPKKLTGLIAATCTPFTPEGEVHYEVIPQMVDFVISRGVGGLYVCGSTGEGMSLTSKERMLVAESSVRAAAGRVPVVVQVGHNSLREARDLAKHASEIGAEYISANAPSYFKVTDVETLIASMSEIAAGAPDVPFYYYHIPILTGAHIDMLDFLERVPQRIPNLVGIKYTAHTMHEFQLCTDFADGAFDILWGSDEMLLGAFAVGGQGAVGSTYNIAAPLYLRMIAAFQAGDLPQARAYQQRAVELVRSIYRWPFLPALKEILRMMGVDCGTCRLPLARLSDQQLAQVRNSIDLDQLLHSLTPSQSHHGARWP